MIKGKDTLTQWNYNPASHYRGGDYRYPRLTTRLAYWIHDAANTIHSAHPTHIELLHMYVCMYVCMYVRSQQVQIAPCSDNL